MSQVNFDVSQTLDITCVKGDTFSMDLTLKDSAGSAIDITNYAFYFQIFKGSSIMISTTDAKSFERQRISSGNVVVTKDADQDTNKGKFNISISSLIMSDFPSGGYFYEMQMSTTGDSSGVDTTILKGNFIVNPDRTAPARR